MTISNNTRTAGPFIGNDAAVAFPFAFKVFSRSDVVVLRKNSTEEKTLTLNADYSVTLNNDQDASPGGIVTLTAALSSNYMLILTSDISETQGTALTNQGGFYPQVIESALDRLTILVQQLRMIVGRSLRFPLSDQGVNTQLPIASSRAGKLLSFDEFGAPSVSIPAAQSAVAFQIALENSSGSSLIGLIRAAAGAVRRTVQEKFGELASVKDFGALGDGINDDTAAINTAFASSAKSIHIPAGTYKVTGTLFVPMGKKITTDGYASELQFYGLTPTTDGISITESASYDFTTIEAITIRAMNASGRHGIVTPSVAGLFANKRPQFFVDALFLGEDKSKTIFAYGWAEMCRIGDCRGGRLNIVGFGRYNPTIDDVGQADDVGVRLTSVTGNIGLTMKVMLNNIRRGVVLSDGSEGFALQDGSEIVGCWYGVDCDNAISEPGGFIGNVHVNTNNRGFRLSKRPEINIGNISVYRSDGFFNHGGTWAALDITDCSLNVSNLNAVHGTTRTAISAAYGAIFRRTNGTLSGYEIRMGSALATAVGVLIDDSDDFIVGNGSFLEVAKLFQFLNGSTDIHVGSVAMRGVHTVTTTKFEFDGTIDRSRIFIDKKRVSDLAGLYSSTSISAAGNLLLVSGTASPMQSVIVNAGAAAYTYDIDLDEAQAVVGDTIRIKLIMPTSANPTVRIRRKTSAFVLSSFNGTVAKRYFAEYMFTGGSWEEMFVFESIEASF